MIDNFFNQFRMILMTNGGFFTGEIILGIVGIILVAYFLRKGDRNPFWLFVFGFGMYVIAEIGAASLGIRELSPAMRLLGGITIGYPIPSVILAFREGGTPTVLSYLFARYAFNKQYKKAVLPLIVIVLLLFNDQVLSFIASGGIPSFLHVYGPLGDLYSKFVWNTNVSIRWLFRPNQVGTFMATTLLGFLALALLNGRRSRYWKFAALHYSAFAFYLLWFVWTFQLWGWRRYVAIPVIDPSVWAAGSHAVFFAYWWIVSGLPWMPWLVNYWLLPANFGGAFVSYAYDILIEAAGSRLCMLTVPLFLGIARIPELEEEGVEVSSAQGWLWALYLFVLVVPISLTSMWLSSLSMNFLTMFTVGIVYGVALVAIASTIIVVIYILWRKIEGEPLKWW
ncbi:MAG: hypothetical protein Q6352_015385 [Candidatus Freyrarchaeum guaymaensis]